MMQLDAALPDGVGVKGGMEAMTPRLAPVPPGSPTFLGAPRCDDVRALDADVAIIGVPFGSPYELEYSTAASAAPRAIREQSMKYVPWYATHYDFDFGGDLFGGRPVRIADCGDVAMAPGAWAENAAATTAAIREILRRGALPVMLGGEHSIPIPVMRAFDACGPMCVVQLDAHIDWRDDRDGVRDGLSSTMRRASELPWVSGMVQIGIRGFGSAREAEFNAARAYGSVIVGAEEVHRAGVEAVLSRVPDAPAYYITLDADGLDPSIAPGVWGPAFGGLTYFEATNLLRGIAAKGRVVGFDVVEVIPSLDVQHMTSRLAARLIMNLLGAVARSGQFGRPAAGTGA
jgi:agmatinase